MNEIEIHTRRDIKTDLKFMEIFIGSWCRVIVADAPQDKPLKQLDSFTEQMMISQGMKCVYDTESNRIVCGKCV